MNHCEEIGVDLWRWCIWILQLYYVTSFNMRWDLLLLMRVGQEWDEYLARRNILFYFLMFQYVQYHHQQCRMGNIHISMHANNTYIFTKTYIQARNTNIETQFLFPLGLFGKISYFFLSSSAPSHFHPPQLNSSSIFPAGLIFPSICLRLCVLFSTFFIATGPVIMTQRITSKLNMDESKLHGWCVCTWLGVLL